MSPTTHTNEVAGTRRTKRKADGVENASPGSARKRRSISSKPTTKANQPPKPAKTAAAKSTPLKHAAAKSVAPKPAKISNATNSARAKSATTKSAAARSAVPNSTAASTSTANKFAPSSSTIAKSVAAASTSLKSSGSNAVPSSQLAKAKPRRSVAKENKANPRPGMNEHDELDVSAIIEKVKSNRQLLSVISEQIQDLDPPHTSPTKDDDFNSFEPTTPSTAHANRFPVRHSSKKTLSSAARKTRSKPTNDDVDDGDDGEENDLDPVFHNVSLEEDDEEDEEDENVIHSNEDNKNADEDDDDLNDQEMQVLGAKTHYSGIGESDEEQDVSFHDALITTDREEIPTPNLASNEEGRGSGELDDVQAVNREEQNLIEQGTAPPKNNNLQLSHSLHGVDESTIFNVAQVLKKSVVAELQDSLGQVLQEIRSDHDRMRKLNDNVTELTSFVTTIAVAVFVKHAATQPRAKEIQRKLCLLPAVFNDHIMLKIIPRVVIGFFVNHVSNSQQFSAIESKGIQIFSVMFFSKQPGECKKDKFESEVGGIYSKYRYSLLGTTILAMQENSFKTFRCDTSNTGRLGPIHIIDSDEASTVGPSITAMTQPFWLKPGYILAEHCVSAAQKQEKRKEDEVKDDQQQAEDSSVSPSGDNESMDMLDSSQSSGKQKAARSGPITRDEISTEAARWVYKIITGVLYRSRYVSKIQMFHDVMYLFVGWAQFKAPVDQSTLKLQWEQPVTCNIDYFDELPRTKLVSPTDRHACGSHEVDKIDLDNVSSLEKLIDHHPELSLLVEHDVMVSGEARCLRYRINLLEVVCRSISSYVTLDSAAKGKDALSADKKCFKVITTMAIGLRRLMAKAIEDLISDNVVLWSNNKSDKRTRGRPRRQTSNKDADVPTSPPLPPYMFEKIYGMDLDQLITAPSKQKELLNNMILTMTEEEFNARSLTRADGGRATLNDNVGNGGHADDIARITADENQCVFRF